MKKLLVIAALALSCTTVRAEEEKKAESIEYVAIPFTNGETKNLWQFCKEEKVQQRGEKPSKDLPSGAKEKQPSHNLK